MQYNNGMGGMWFKSISQSKGIETDVEGQKSLNSILLYCYKKMHLMCGFNELVIKLDELLSRHT